MMQALELQRLMDAGQVRASDVGFATSLLQAVARNKATAKQLAWIPQLIARATGGGAPAPGVQLTGDVRGIFALFETASARGLKWPKINLATGDGTPVVFNRAGDRSKYPGQVQITDGGRYPENRYFGRIDLQGQLVPGPKMTPGVRELVERFAADPATVAADYGKLTGHCCFCRLKLDDEKSTALGYGPVCAKKFGLPWGRR